MPSPPRPSDPWPPSPQPPPCCPTSTRPAPRSARWPSAPVRPLDPLGALVYGAWGHRGPLHSLPGLAAFGALAALPMGLAWGAEYGAAALLGYGSHLALDGMTRHGIPLLPTRGRDGLWGLRRRRHLLPRPLRFVTGSPAEDILQAFLFGVALLLLIQNLVQNLV